MSLPAFQDPNAAAAANAGRGLANLGNFIYEQTVTKPAVQAQTAQTMAQTGGVQASTQAQQLANKAATLAYGHQTLDFGSGSSNGASVNPPDASAAFHSIAPSMATDISTPANASQTRTVTAGSGSGTGSEPAAASASITSQNNTPAAGQTSSVGPSGTTDSNQGVPKAPQFQLSQSDLANLSANDIPVKPPGTFDLSTVRTPKSPAGTPVAGAAPGTSAPATVPPGTAGSPLSAQPSPAPLGQTPQMASGDVRDRNAGKAWDEITPGDKQELLSRGHAQLQKLGVDDSDSSIGSTWNNQQLASRTPLAMRQGLTLTSADVNGMKFVSTALMNGDVAGTNNAGSNPAFIFRPDGTVGPNPDHAEPKVFKETQEDLNALDTAQRSLTEIGTAMSADPQLVGTITGERPGNVTRAIESGASAISGGRIGSTENYAGQKLLEQFKSGKFLDALGSMHGIGRMDVPIVEQAKKQIPDQNAPLSRWQDYLSDQQADLNKRRQATLEEYKRQGGQARQGTAFPPINSAELPVNTAGLGQTVDMVKNADGTWSAPPASSSAPAKSSLPVMRTPEEAKQKLAPGTWFQTPQGVPRQLH